MSRHCLGTKAFVGASTRLLHSSSSLVVLHFSALVGPLASSMNLANRVYLSISKYFSMSGIKLFASLLDILGTYCLKL